MEELYNLELSDSTIRSMLEICPNIKDYSVNQIKEKEYILEKIGCNKKQIRNIISSNAFYLEQTNENIIKLIEYLKKIGFKTLSILIDSNPYILNLEIYEIKNYINKRINKGEIFEDIIDDLDSNPYLFSEM